MIDLAIDHAADITAINTSKHCCESGAEGTTIINTSKHCCEPEAEGTTINTSQQTEVSTRSISAPSVMPKTDPMIRLAANHDLPSSDVRIGVDRSAAPSAEGAVRASTPCVGKNRWHVPSIPSELGRQSNNSGIFVSVDYAEGNINGADDFEREIEIALDSGAVDHVICTDLLPSSTEIAEVTGTRIGKNFVAANGQPMKTFGECILECGDENGKSAASFAVTEVSRALQSVSRMCDQGLEVLFTRTEAKVRDPKTGKFVARFARRGGLYTRSVKVRPGRRPTTSPPNDKSGRRAQPFQRQSKKA